MDRKSWCITACENRSGGCLCSNGLVPADIAPMTAAREEIPDHRDTLSWRARVGNPSHGHGPPTGCGTRSRLRPPCVGLLLFILFFFLPRTRPISNVNTVLPARMCVQSKSYEQKKANGDVMHTYSATAQRILVTYAWKNCINYKIVRSNSSACFPLDTTANNRRFQ